MAGIDDDAVESAFAERLATVAGLPMVQWTTKTPPTEQPFGTLYIRAWVGRNDEVKKSLGLTVGSGSVYFEVLHSDSDETQIAAAGVLANAIKNAFPPDDILLANPEVRVMKSRRNTVIIDSSWRIEPIAVDYEAYSSS